MTKVSFDIDQLDSMEKMTLDYIISMLLIEKVKRERTFKQDEINPALYR